MRELTLAVVGIDFPNADRSNRRSEALMTLPGDPVALRPEPRNAHDRHAIAVISARGIQIGYVTAERAPYIGGRMARGETVTAIFQGLEGAVAFIRVRFGGGMPTLPQQPDVPPASPGPDRQREPYDPHAFYPDDEGPEWGA